MVRDLQADVGTGVSERRALGLLLTMAGTRCKLIAAQLR
jgi:hypothetical protein